MSHPPLPRDLDVAPLRAHVLQHRVTADAPLLSYFPLPVLVFVTEVAGNNLAKRLETARDCADMLRYRSTQLSIPLEDLLKSASSEWNPTPGPHPAQPPDADYVSHRGFLEVIAYWINQKVVAAGGSSTVVVKDDPYARLKKFAANQAAIGELLFGVVMPPPPPPPPAETPLPSAAFLTPAPPAGPVTASLPPAGVQTIQDEIAAAQSAPSAGGAAAAAGDVAVKTEDAAAAPAAVAAATSAVPFAVPSDGIPVLVTRYDGRDLHALPGKLRSILADLTLSSPMPADRNPAQTLSVGKEVKGEACTIEQYWGERSFVYADPALKDAGSRRRIRICAVELDEGPPFIYPADKVWRQVGSAGTTATRPAVPIPEHALGPEDRSSRFFPAAAAVEPPAHVYSPLAQLWLAVAADPFHFPSWQKLLAEAHQTHDLHTIRHAYGAFLKVFPTSATHWKSLVEVELAHEQYEEVKRILNSVLLRLPEVELWKLYLVYIRIIHTPAAGSAASEAATQAMNVAIENAYEFVLKHVGLDLHAGQVWKSYINFMRGIPARSSAEEAGKTASLRRIFQRALQVPLQPKELDILWNEYEAFEKSASAAFANKTLSNKLVAEALGKYQTTLAVSRERRKKFQGILGASVGNAYGIKHAVTSANIHVASRPSASPLQQCLDALQMQYWIRYIRFEQYQSPHLLKQDTPTFRARVLLAYRQCLLYCRHYPNIWSDLIKFHVDTHSSPEEIRAVWKEFREALPYSIMPALIHADYEEEQKHMAAAKDIYETLLVCKGKEEPPAEEHSFTLPPEVVAEQRAAKAARQRAEDSAAATASAAAAAATAAPSSGTDGAAVAAAVVGAGPSAVVVKEEPKPDSKSASTADGLVDIYQGALHHVHPLVFILLMRFIRRCEGNDAARKVLMGSRRHPDATSHLYLYAAHTEFHVNNDLTTAQAIWNAGMRVYGDKQESFLMAYLAFLRETNDHQNLRLNYGRLLLTESAESAEKQAHLTKTEKAQMRKAQQAATAAKEGAAAAAAAAAAASSASQSDVPVEAEDDPAIKADDWWAHVNMLLPSSARPPAQAASERYGRSGGGGSSGSRSERQQDREDRADRTLPPLPSASLLSLWSSYVSFERDTANELSVIIKAEQKRDEKLSIRYAHRLVVWADRWRFGDLWPCSRALRQTIDKMIRPDSNMLLEMIRGEMAAETERNAQVAGTAASASASAAGTAPAGADSASFRHRGVLTTDASVATAFKGALARPDVSRLAPYIASAQAMDRAAVRLRYGGATATPVPEQILNVLSVLPPANLFQGPFVHPLTIIEMLQLVQVPEGGAGAAAPAAPAAAGASAGDGSTDADGAGRRGGKGGRGKRKQQDQADEEEEAAAAAAAMADANTPANDLYRKRQQQKMAKIGE